jgi:riboflavin synthase
VFTGLVADLGEVVEADRSAEGVRLRVASPLAAVLDEGDSVAVNGVCLTAVAVSPRDFAAEVMHETLRRSSLEAAAPGARVNLELPLRPSDRLGGHIVQGHVDGTGSVEEVHEDGFARRVRIGAGPEVLRYVVPKGSIAVDGVSLIPETLQRTNLGTAERGQRVNLEVDVLAKYVERLLAR